MTLAGIDVSAAGQGANFDWASYKGKIAFAGIKVSEGTTYADPDAKANIAGARSIGATVIGYHFLHSGDTGAAQAAWFLDCCQKAGIERGDALAADVEQGGLDGLSTAQLWAVAADFADAIHGHFACWPLAYTDLSLAASALPGALGDCPLWLANPTGIPVTSVGPWKAITAEQTGQRGVDTDVFYGDAAQLAALGIPKAAPAPAAPAKPTAAEAQAALTVLQAYLG